MPEPQLDRFFRRVITRPLGAILAIAAIQAVVYGVIAWLSPAFAHGSTPTQRPIIVVLALFGVSCVLYLIALYSALRCPAGKPLAGIIIAAAVLFRLILVPSLPIQEIDFYRYLWDGAVTARCITPYRYSPEQVETAGPDQQQSEDLRQLEILRDSSPALEGILGRIHYAELPTVYPPVSQAVFALTDRLTPHDASIQARLLILKAVLLAFDVGTIAMVWLLVRAAGIHPGWVVAYAWCPLVLKEFANSAHLDSIAVFLSTAAVWCVVQSLAKHQGRKTIWLLTGALLLGLAVGAKLYAIVLLPLLAAAVAASFRWKTAAWYATVAAIFSVVCLAPMLLASPAETNSAVAAAEPAEPQLPDKIHQYIEASKELWAITPLSGLKAFLTRWEMNDLLFMLVVDNLRPRDSTSTRPEAWFVVVPAAQRQLWMQPVTSLLDVDQRTAAFLLARAVTTMAFLAIMAVLVWNVMQRPEVAILLEAAFLILAWFWILSPTQNPWYWIWAVPLLPFARSRVWLVVSGSVFLYYLRFWLKYHFPVGPVLGTPYDGTDFFQFVVTWFEHVPWLAWLTVAAIARNTRFPRKCTSGHVATVTGFTDKLHEPR